MQAAVRVFLASVQRSGLHLLNRACDVAEPSTLEEIYTLEDIELKPNTAHVTFAV